MNKEEIIESVQATFTALSNYCESVNEKDFFNKLDNKWSVAENLQHLILSTNMSTLGYSLPIFLVRIIGGTPNRVSRSFDELLAKYTTKLAAGATASGRFIPKPIAINVGKEKLLNNWQSATRKFIVALQRNRTETDLDNYIVKHPLLGKITLRELCYFTIFHTTHHLQSLQKNYGNSK